MSRPEPGPENAFLCEHAELLISSYRRIRGRELIERKGSREESAQALYVAPFGVVSHGLGNDPIFNYANRTALELFEMSWADFIALPSRQSAEAVNWEQRQKLLEQVARHGFVDGYQGVRISATGKRFRIEQTTIWNVIDEQNVYRGQAAAIFHWSAI